MKRLFLGSSPRPTAIIFRYMKKCNKCNKNLPKSNFHSSAKSPDKLFHWCKTCRSNFDKKRNSKPHIKALRTKRRNEWEEKTRKFILKYLRKGCSRCPEKDIRTLDFNHLRNKKYNICNLVRKHNFSLLQAEVKKCEVVCANCHRKYTAKQQNWWSNRLLEAG